VEEIIEKAITVRTWNEDL
jgi:hypothetical protein